MTDDISSRVTDDSKVTLYPGSNPGATPAVRQRKKRKWDQPAESLISAGLAVPGMLPFVGAGNLPGIGLPGMVSQLAGVIPSAAMQSSFMSIPQVSSTLTSAVVHQNAVAIVQKFNQDLAMKGLLPQSKIQDELIAREIVINDADPTVRYKLTKRQTQEEIQAKTGAVVITRGRYRPPNGPVENEKPLYLHISAGAHLKDTAERIKAVDLAAIMVEEIMKQGRQIQSASNPLSAVPAPGGLPSPPFSTAVYVGLEADPTLNLVSRIRGPNDQYINHIMNETGATVVLRGRGSGNYEGLLGEELQQPLHLYISSENAKSIENAKSLAENLLETIRSEFLTARSPTYQVAVAGSIPIPVMPSGSLQSSISPYQVSSYPMSTLSAGPYAGIYPQAVVSYTQTPTSTYSLSLPLPQPGSVNSADLISTDPNINKSSTTRVYNAVPPPQQLLSESEVAKVDTEKSNGISTESTSIVDLTAVISSSSSTAVSSAAIAPSSISAQPNLACTGLYGMQGAVTSNAQNYTSPLPCLPLSYGQPTSASIPQVQQNQQTQPPYVAGTNYSGYGGIYPQATPLQQVALALQRPPPPVSVRPGFTHSTSAPPTKAQSSYSNGQSEKQPAQRRKFQELPVAAKERSRDNQKSLQVTEFSKFGELSDPSTKKLHSMPPPKNVPMAPPKDMPPPSAQCMQPPSAQSVPPPSNSMPSPSSGRMSPPPLRSMFPPQTVSLKRISESNSEDSSHHVSDTSLKLVEYGEEDDDDSSNPGTPPKANGTQYTNGKPFWAP